MLRLNKYIAECGICSRRSADILISSGKVKVNSQVVTQLGEKVDEINDIVEVNSKAIKKEEEYVYIMLNKPKGYVTTAKDQFERKSVLELIDTNFRIFPIGRLDMYTEGLLLLTNDGEFANKMMHPRNKIEKTYIAKVSGNITDEKINSLKNGVDIGDYITKKAKVIYSDCSNELKITISEGKNRQVRRMCEAVGLSVINLKRIKVGNLILGDLKLGKYRYLTKQEISKI